ncbi:MAG: hypothetical protein LBR40_00395 [Bacilli bacterium]|jgi:hypothetical protein|nr:hypothetical protein [Bacilli bacterium]
MKIKTNYIIRIVAILIILISSFIIIKESDKCITIMLNLGDMANDSSYGIKVIPELISILITSSIFFIFGIKLFINKWNNNHFKNKNKNSKIVSIIGIVITIIIYIMFLKQYQFMMYEVSSLSDGSGNIYEVLPHYISYYLVDMLFIIFFINIFLKDWNES